MRRETDKVFEDLEKLRWKVLPKLRRKRCEVSGETK